MAPGEDAFDRADNRSHVIVTIVSTLVPFATVIVALRLYTRHFLGNGLSLDDWMSGWSMIMVIITGAVMILEAQTGLGTHRVFLSDEEYMQYNKLFYVDVIFYIAGLAFIKFHVLLQYYRLFSVKMRRVTVWVTGLVCIWGLASTFAVIFICDPIPGAWDPSIDARCIPPMPQWYTNAAGNIITDFVIFCLPIRVLWRLKLERSQRIPLLAVFCLGFFTCCISIIRISYLDILQGDETYHNVSTAGWSIGEMCCAMVASCVPTLRPLLYVIAPGLRRGTSSGSSGGDLEHGQQILTLQTIGGSYVGSVGSGTRKERRAVKAAARNKSASTDELTMETAAADADVELVTAMRHSMEKKLRSGSTSDGEMLPIQHPPPLQAADELAEMLGLRVSTQTTVVATRPREPGLGFSPRALGIRVKRDITQTHH